MVEIDSAFFVALSSLRQDFSSVYFCVSRNLVLQNSLTIFVSVFVLENTHLFELTSRLPSWKILFFFFSFSQEDDGGNTLAKFYTFDSFYKYTSITSCFVS